jgi:hypothetical protein
MREKCTLRSFIICTFHKRTMHTAYPTVTRTWVFKTIYVQKCTYVFIMRCVTPFYREIVREFPPYKPTIIVVLFCRSAKTLYYRYSIKLRVDVRMDECLGHLT